MRSVATNWGFDTHGFNALPQRLTSIRRDDGEPLADNHVEATHNVGVVEAGHQIHLRHEILDLAVLQDLEGDVTHHVPGLPIRPGIRTLAQKRARRKRFGQVLHAQTARLLRDVCGLGQDLLQEPTLGV